MQNIGTPRIYVNDIAWGKALGLDIINENTSAKFTPERMNHFISSNPSKQLTWTHDHREHYYMRFNRINVGDGGRPNYVAYLGHNFASAKVYPRHHYRKADNDPSGDDHGWNKGNGIPEVIVNCNPTSIFWDTADNDSASKYCAPDYDGFSIVEVNASLDGTYFVESVQFNADDYD